MCDELSLQDSGSDREAAMDTERPRSYSGQVSQCSRSWCAHDSCVHFRHWIAVFGLVLDRTMKDTITGLCRYVTTRSSKRLDYWWCNSTASG